MNNVKNVDGISPIGVRNRREDQKKEIYVLQRKMEVIEDIEKLVKFFKVYIHEPKNSNGVGEIYTLLKRLNNVLS